MPRVVHFEIPAQKPERAIKFYKGVFGWKFSKWDGPMEYWMVMTGEKDEHGINGGLYKRKGKPMKDIVGAYVCTIDVPDIDSYLKRAKSMGAKVVMPKDEIKGVGYFAQFKDTEGNLFGMMQATGEMAMM